MGFLEIYQDKIETNTHASFSLHAPSILDPLNDPMLLLWNMCQCIHGSSKVTLLRSVISLVLYSVVHPLSQPFLTFTAAIIAYTEQ